MERKRCLICTGPLPSKCYFYCSNECRSVVERLRKRRRGKSSRYRSICFRRDKGKCRKCGKVCKPHEWQADHIVPISAGGERRDPDNLRTLCIPCHDEITKEDRKTRRYSSQASLVDVYRDQS